jgi:hypothetical protein
MTQPPARPPGSDPHAVPGSAVSVQDLAWFGEVFGDLADPDVMSRAWE